MTTLNSFGTVTTLTTGADTFEYYSLPALERAGFPGVGRLPYSLKILLENLLRREDGRVREGRRHPRAGELGRHGAAAEGDLLHAGARPAAGLHRRAVRRRSRRDARRHRRARRRPAEGQPAAAGRARHRSLGAGRSLRHGRRAAAERRARVPPQPRALRVPALGPDGVRNFRVVPPETGIVHQVNIEYLARVVCREERERPARSRIPTRCSAPTRTRRW